jgi:polyferredoxin
MSTLGFATSLRTVKLVHTAVWAFFATSIIGIPLFAWTGDFRSALVLIAIVLVEVVVLVFNGLRCPLTAVAARYTADRRDNFDIYLPEWLARHNKLIFGPLYLFGILLTLSQWVRQL